MTFLLRTKITLSGQIRNAAVINMRINNAKNRSNNETKSRDRTSEKQCGQSCRKKSALDAVFLKLFSYLCSQKQINF